MNTQMTNALSNLNFNSTFNKINREYITSKITTEEYKSKCESLVNNVLKNYKNSLRKDKLDKINRTR